MQEFCCHLDVDMEKKEKEFQGAISGFDKATLKHADVNEKNILPDKAGEFYNYNIYKLMFKTWTLTLMRHDRLKIRWDAT